MKKEKNKTKKILHIIKKIMPYLKILYDLYQNYKN